MDVLEAERPELEDYLAIAALDYERDQSVGHYYLHCDFLESVTGKPTADEEEIMELKEKLRRTETEVEAKKARIQEEERSAGVGQVEDKGEKEKKSRSSSRCPQWRKTSS